MLSLTTINAVFATSFSAHAEQSANAIIFCEFCTIYIIRFWNGYALK